MDIISTNLLLSIRNNTPVSSSQHLNAIEQITLDHRLHDPDAQQRHEDQCGHARYDLRCEDGIVGEFIVDWLGGSVEFDGHSSLCLCRVMIVRACEMRVAIYKNNLLFTTAS